MSYDARQTRINEIRQDLANVRQAKRDLISGGQSVSVAGGVSVSRANLADLNREENRLIAQLNAIVGSNTIPSTVPDFSGTPLP